MRRPRVAVLTAAGLGAVAVVRVWGAGALAVADSAFRPHRGPRLADTPAGRPRVGRVGAGLGDEVVAIVMPGDSVEVEVQCHGGPAAIGAVVDAILEAGAVRSSATAWVRSSSGSRIRAEATLDVAHAATLRAAAHLLDQADGALDRELLGIRDDLAGRPDSALARLDALLARAPVGVRLVTGWSVALAGRPNVGKSRLLNALVGHDRAIVDPMPGTTRDVVTSRTAFDGWPVELADTAGLRPSDDPIESLGVALARARHRSSDLVILVLDRSEPLTDEDRRLSSQHNEALIVANKADLPGVWEFDGLEVSAERGDGIDRLASEIGRRLVPDPPALGLALPFRPAHVRRLQSLKGAIVSGDRTGATRSLDRWLG